jgi:hypothetical protein
VRRSRPELWRQKCADTSRQKHHLTFPFSPGNIWTKQHHCRPPTHPTFLCYPYLR